jgi:hypothetical protein
VLSAAAGVIDRVAVTVGNQVITESEVNDEVRLTQFLNQQPLDLGPKQRRAAAERLVDQQLIRNEMRVGGFANPSADEADSMLRNFRQEHYASILQFRADLEKYGITEEQLKQHLLWELTALRFTDIRFRGGTSTSQQQTANRLKPGAEATPEESPAEENNVDPQLDAWLKDARSQTRIEFKKEAFQ